MKLTVWLSLIFVCCWAMESDPVVVKALDRKPIVWKVYGVRRAEALDAQRIRLTIGHASNAGVLERHQSYRIVSEDDPFYAYKKFVMPAKTVRLNKKQEKELTAPEGIQEGIQVFNRYLVELQLPKEMEDGKTYSVVCQGYEGQMVSAGRTAATLTYHVGEFVKPLEVKEDKEALTVMGLRGASHVGNGIICLEFGATFSPKAGYYLKDYEVTVDGRPVNILKMGRRSKIDAYLPEGWPFPGIVMHEIFLQLEKPLAEDAKVRIRVSPKICSGANETGFIFNSRSSFSDSIKVNQVGYLVDLPVKRAYLGRWLGSFPDKNAVGMNEKEVNLTTTAGEFYDIALKKRVKDGEKVTIAPFALGFKEAPSFCLVDAQSGEEVFRGKAQFVHNGLENDGRGNHSAENVYYLDFNQFNKPGRYYISVDGVGRSFEFAISDDVFQSAFQMASHGVFLQRCGMEFGPPYTPWRRIACHARGITETTQERINSKNFIDPVNQILVENTQISSEEHFKKLLTPSLVAYFPFDGDCVNAIKGGMELKANGKSKYVEDGSVTGEKTGQVYMTRGDGNDGFTGTLDFQADKGLTFGFWYKKDDSVSGGKVDGTILSLKLSSHEKLDLSCLWGIPNLRLGRERISYNRVGDNIWRHWGIVVKPLNAADERGNRNWQVSLYINGEFINGFTGKATLGREFTFAGLLAGGGANGFFDDLRIYNQVLSAKDMKLLSKRFSSHIPKLLMTSGGHHDAGDYNPRSHIDVAQKLMDAYELAPRKFWDGQLNIPEKGNGIPDIIDEALWALKLWIGLQDEDGGVFNGTESDGDPNFIQTVELDPKGDFAWAKDCKGSFLFAGSMAQAARILKGLGQTSAAENFIVRARRAYDWACEHKPETKNIKALGEYTISLRAYAAAQLYHTTGLEAYHKDFKEYTPWIKNPNAKMITDDYSYDLSLAAYAYSMIPDDMALPVLKMSVIRAIEGESDMYVSGSDKMAYKFIRHPFAPITWGTGAYEHFLVPVWHAWGVTKDAKKRKEYFEWMVRTADNTLGANPMNISWIVGLGERTVRAPLHNSRYNPSGMCMPGQQTQGPNSQGKGYNYTKTVYPPHDNGFAVMHAFVDCHWAIAMDEGTVNNQAETMAAFGLLLKDREK